MSNDDPTTLMPPNVPDPEATPGGSDLAGFEDHEPIVEPGRREAWNFMREQKRAATEGQIEAEGIRREVSEIQNKLEAWKAGNETGFIDVRRIGPMSLPSCELGRIGKLKFAKLTDKRTLEEEILAQWGGGEYQLLARRANNTPVPNGEWIIEIAGTPTMVSDEGRKWERRQRGEDEPKQTSGMDSVERAMELVEKMKLRAGVGTGGGGDSTGLALLLQESQQRHDKWMREETDRRDQERADRAAREEKENAARAAREAERKKLDDEEREERRKRWEADTAARQQEHERRLQQDRLEYKERIARIDAEAVRQQEIMKAQIESRRDANMLDPKRLRELVTDLTVKRISDAAGLPDADEEPKGWGDTLRGLLQEHGGELIKLGVEAIGSRIVPNRAAPPAPPRSLIHTPTPAATDEVDVEDVPVADATPPAGATPDQTRVTLTQVTSVNVAMSVMNFTRVLAAELLSQRTPSRAWVRPQNEDGTSLADLFDDMPQIARDALPQGWQRFKVLVPPPAAGEVAVIDDLLARHPNGVAWMRAFLEVGPWVDDDSPVDFDGDGAEPITAELPPEPPPAATDDSGAAPLA